MERRQAFKFELIPNGEQPRQIRRFAGSVRFFYNKALALQKEKKAKVMSPVAAWGDWPPPLMDVFAGEAGQRWSQESRRLKEVFCVPRHS
jgi:transposase